MRVCIRCRRGLSETADKLLLRPCHWYRLSRWPKNFSRPVEWRHRHSLFLVLKQMRTEEFLSYFKALQKNVRY